jgi:Rps23 Pro-64 3,4-dihydroxylase Tpa1-like proline 4-hydroxylase
MMISEEVLQQADALKTRFQTAKPFRHICIDNFFEQDKARALLADFPAFDPAKAINEFGKPSGKVTKEKLQDISPFYKQVHDYLLSERFLKEMSALTGIEDFVPDPTFFGGGTHENTNGQELAPHVDFNYLDGHNLHRRVNLLLYLNEGWREEWGGVIQLHENPRDPEHDRISSYNRAVIFETNEVSWHGFPRIDLPQQLQDRSRKSLSVYLYTKDRPASEKAGPHATFYVQRPLSDRFVEGHVLTAQDIGELNGAMSIRDTWITNYQKKEEELGRQLIAIESHCEELQKYIRLPITGFARQNQVLSGVLFHDCWASSAFEVEMKATRAISTAQVTIEIPDHFPKIQRMVLIGIDGQKTKFVLAGSGMINLVLPLQAAQGGVFRLSVECDTTFNPAKAGAGADGRDLAFRLEQVLFE